MKKILEYLLESLRSDCGVLEPTFCAAHIAVTTLYGSMAAVHFSDMITWRNDRFYMKSYCSIEKIIHELEARS